MVFFTSDGAVAQMGERVTGSHKVRGSIPLSSTNDLKGLGVLPNPFILFGVSIGVSLMLIFSLNDGWGSSHSWAGERPAQRKSKGFSLKSNVRAGLPWIHPRFLPQIDSFRL